MGLVHWWPLNGTLDDQGSNPIKLTNYSATVNDSGKMGQCYAFSGSSQYLGYSSGAVVSGPFTIALWVKSNSSSSTQCLFCNRGTTTGAGPAIFIISGNSIRFDTVNTGCACSYPTDLEWHHIVCSYSGSQRKIYLDGVLKTTTATTSLGTTSNYFTFGGSGANSLATGNWLNGSINDYRIYDYALTEAEIKDLYLGLTLHYTFDPLMVLPSAYHRLQYIETTGTQCFDSEVKADGNKHRYYLEYMKTTTGTGSSLFGASNSNSGWTSVPYFTGASNGALYTGSSSGLISFTQTYNVKHTYDVTVNNTTKQVISVIDGTTKVSKLFNGTPYNNMSIGIFMQKMSATNFSQKFTGRIYCFKMWKDDVLVFYGIPCYRVSDNAGGLFDIISGEFKANVGIGNVTLGGDITDYTGKEFDIAGFGYTGTYSTMPTYSSNTERYLRSSTLTTYNTPVLTVSNASKLKALTNCSVCWWAKETTTGNHLLLTGQSTSYYIAAYSTSSATYNGEAGSNTITYYKDGIQGSWKSVDTNWHFYCITGISFATWTAMKINGHSGTWPLNAQLSDLRIYAKPLTSAEVLAIYNERRV